jgi:hypothetical protein
MREKAVPTTSLPRNVDFLWEITGHKAKKKQHKDTNPKYYALIKKKIKFSSYIGKFTVEQFAKSYMTNGFPIYGEIFSHFLIY